MKRILTVLLAALLVLSLSLPVFAAESPNAPKAPTVKVETSNENNGTVKKEELPDGRFRFTATPSEGSTFEGWEFDGDVTIVEGTEKDPVIVVEVNGDVTATAKFTPTTTQKPADGDGSDKAPNMGDSSAMFILIAMITMAGAAVFCKKIFA